MTVTGSGKYLQTFTLDGVAQTPFFPATMTGRHTIVMTMGNTPPVAVLLRRGGAAGFENTQIKISSGSNQGIRLTFGSCLNVKASIYSVTGRCIGVYATSNGTVTIGNRRMFPGTYVVKWNSDKVDWFQKIVLK